MVISLTVSLLMGAAFLVQTLHALNYMPEAIMMPVTVAILSKASGKQIIVIENICDLIAKKVKVLGTIDQCQC